MSPDADPPDDRWAREVCLIGHGERTCRYITMTANGWSCAKHSSLRAHLDERVRTKTMGARGDNCPGKGERL
jgi:hypothetical protein